MEDNLTADENNPDCSGEDWVNDLEIYNAIDGGQALSKEERARVVSKNEEKEREIYNNLDKTLSEVSKRLQKAKK